jgi:hypothetical protein
MVSDLDGARSAKLMSYVDCALYGSRKEEPKHGFQPVPE